LKDEAYVLNGINGQSVASTGQLFQVNVQPYTPPITEMQTTETSTQMSNSTLATTTFPLPATTPVESITQAATSSQTQLVESTEASSAFTGQLLVPAAILLVGLIAFGFLMFTASRRKRASRSKKHCGQCGTELNQNEKYCTHCGAKQSP
jgi:hypothetical protein